MKSLKLLLFPLFVFVIASAAFASVANATTRSNGNNNVVVAVDVDGTEEVKVGHRYHIVPGFAFGQLHGGVKLAHLDPREKCVCPGEIVLSSDVLDLGFPVEFIPENESDTVVMESKNVIIKFKIIPYNKCPQAWSADFDACETPPFRFFLQAGDEAIAPQYFKIEPIATFTGLYKLTTCLHNNDDDCYTLRRSFDIRTNATRIVLGDNEPGGNDLFSIAILKFGTIIDPESGFNFLQSA